MNFIKFLPALVVMTFSSVLAKDEQAGAVKIQIVGEVVEPKNLEIKTDKAIEELFREAKATEFATKIRVVVIRFEHVYHDGPDGIIAGSNTITRDLKIDRSAPISSLDLKNGDIVCVVTKPPVGR